jgi:hypothetical protein
VPFPEHGGPEMTILGGRVRVGDEVGVGWEGGSREAVEEAVEEEEEEDSAPPLLLTNARELTLFKASARLPPRATR